MSQRLVNLDALRGLAALLVVLSHLIPAIPALNSTLMGSFLGHYNGFGHSGVVAFFLLSGYVIGPSIGNGKYDIRRFWINRFFRLWPVYILSMPLAYYTGVINHIQTMEWWQSLVNFTMLQQFVGVPNALGIFWTLEIELLFYLVATLLASKGLLQRREVIQVMVSISALVAVLMGILLPEEGKMSELIPFGWGLTLIFLGMLIRLDRREHRHLPWLAIAGVVALMGFIDYLDSGRFVSRTAAFSFAGILLFLLFEQVKMKENLLSQVGKLSYSLYLLHLSAMLFVETQCMEGVYYLTREWPDITVQIIFIFYVLSMSICFAMLSYLFIERPFQRYSRQLLVQKP